MVRECTQGEGNANAVKPPHRPRTPYLVRRVTVVETVVAAYSEDEAVAMFDADAADVVVDEIQVQTEDGGV